MKLFILLGFLFCSSLAFSEILPKEVEYSVRGNKKGEFYWLRKMTSVDKKTSGSVDGFFLFGLGSVGGSINQELVVNFSYGRNGKYYFMTQLPLSRLSIMLHPEKIDPYLNISDPGTLRYYEYTIHCWEKEWTPDIILPMNKVR